MAVFCLFANSMQEKNQNIYMLYFTIQMFFFKHSIITLFLQVETLGII